MVTVIKNGTIITASDTYKADIYIQKEKIVDISEVPRTNNQEEVKYIEASNKYIFPGGIDVHTHLGGPNNIDDFYSGTRAAAYGGTTCIIDFCVQDKGQSLSEAMNIWHTRADGRSIIDYSFHIAITDFNSKVINELPSIIEKGVTSIKCFLAFKDSLMIDDSVFFMIMQKAREYGALVCVHAENGSVIDVLIKACITKGQTTPFYHAVSRPPECELEATNRAIVLSEIAHCPIHIVHVSNSKALNVIKMAQSRNIRVTAETCPHYLYLSLENLEEPNFEGAKYVMSPPLRAKEHQEPLWQSLINGGIDIVATDHSSFNFKGQKELGREDFSKIPNGIPGIEERLLLIYNGGVLKRSMSLNRFVEVVSTAPAKIFGLYPQKGTIAVGSDADLVIFNPNKDSILSKNTLHYKCDYTAYEGYRLKGQIETVLCRGQILVENHQLKEFSSTGKFIKRKNFFNN